jgi:uncharacterized protein
VPLGLKRKSRYFDVPVQDMVLRVSGPDRLYEEVRAAGMECWEQIQSYAIRNPAFRTSKRPIAVPEDAPAIVRRMAGTAASAGVGPMFTFQGAVTEHVGRLVGQSRPDVVVSCGGDTYVVAQRRSRLVVHPGPHGRSAPLAVVVRPELGPHGIYTTMGRRHMPADIRDEIVVVAGSCILADAAAAAASAILSRPNSFRAALLYLQRLNGVHGGMVVRRGSIGLAGSLELAA